MLLRGGIEGFPSRRDFSFRGYRDEFAIFQMAEINVINKSKLWWRKKREKKKKNKKKKSCERSRLDASISLYTGVPNLNFFLTIDD